MYELKKTCWGWMIHKNDPRHRFGTYLSKVKRDGSYEFVTDYTYAKRFSEKTAKKHLEILEKGDK
jgi:hypothetical protein